MAAILEDRIIKWNKLSPDNRVVFMHSPKAAGSSVSLLMAEHYGDKMFRIGPYVPDTWAPYLPKGFNQFSALSAHSSVRDEIYRMFDGPFAHLVLFREPVDRVMSAYTYMISNPSYHSHGELINRSMTDIFESGDGQNLGLMNRVLQDLSGVFDPDPSELDAAKESIEKNFSFFGFFEDLGWFVNACSKKFNWGTSLSHVNNSNRSAIKSSVVELIREYNKCDIELYEHAKEIHNKRVSEGFYG